MLVFILSHQWFFLSYWWCVVTHDDEEGTSSCMATQIHWCGNLMTDFLVVPNHLTITYADSNISGKRVGWMQQSAAMMALAWGWWFDSSDGYINHSLGLFCQQWIRQWHSCHRTTARNSNSIWAAGRSIFQTMVCMLAMLPLSSISQPLRDRYLWLWHYTTQRISGCLSYTPSQWHRWCPDV